MPEPCSGASWSSTPISHLTTHTFQPHPTSRPGRSQLSLASLPLPTHSLRAHRPPATASLPSISRSLTPPSSLRAPIHPAPTQQPSEFPTTSPHPLTDVSIVYILCACHAALPRSSRGARPPATPIPFCGRKAAKFGTGKGGEEAGSESGAGWGPREAEGKTG